MSADDVTATLDLARAATGVDPVRVEHRPSLLSHNGPCYIGGALKTLLKDAGMQRYAWSPLPFDDAGEDRVLAPVDEERREAGELLPAMNSWYGQSHASLRTTTSGASGPRDKRSHGGDERT